MDILSSYMQSPRGPSRLYMPTYTRKESHELCDDSVVIDIFVVDGVLKDFAYQGNMSLTAVASMSFLYDMLCGMTVQDICNLHADFFVSEGVIVTQRRQKTLIFPQFAIINALLSWQGFDLIPDLEIFAHDVMK